VEIDLAKVPKRESGMIPYEILLSESQERMLIIVKQGREQVVRDIFEKWDLPYAEVGVVKDDGMMRVRNNGDLAVEIPAKKLADEAPVYVRDVQPLPTPDDIDLSLVADDDPRAALLEILAEPSIASKRWVYRQYDHTVRAGTVVPPGSDAAVFLIREANKIVAATTDCNALYCRIEPRAGARIAVAEAARNLACVGAMPIAVTDNLNFGNPHNPANFWQLRECVEGLAEACRAFKTPVTGGNVSLYNESPGGTVDPTPTVGMVGLIDDERHIATAHFKNATDAILLLGALGDGERPARGLGASHYLKVIHGRKTGRVPSLNYEREIALQETLRALIRSRLVRSAHDCSEGGLAVALAESCIGGPAQIGAVLDLGDAEGMSPVQALFNEAQSRVVLSVSAPNAAVVLALCEWRGVPARRIGTVGGAFLAVSIRGVETRWSCEELHRAWAESIERTMGEEKGEKLKS